MEDGLIKDSQITASSSKHGGCCLRARYARLYNNIKRGLSGGWSPEEDTLNQWIQVDLRIGVIFSPGNITGVIIQGIKPQEVSGILQL